MNRDDANKALQMTCDVLDMFGHTYWIDSGTVLSAYRDKDINIYDHDIDIRTIREEWSEDEMPELIKALWSIGYSKIADTGVAWEQLLAFHIGDILLDFKFCHRDDKHIWYTCFGDSSFVIHLYDRKFIDNLEKIELFGREYHCPGPVEEYIETHYGPDWRDFKVRASEAHWTDMIWDFMKDPPICYTPEQFMELKGREFEFGKYTTGYRAY